MPRCASLSLCQESRPELEMPGTIKLSTVFLGRLTSARFDPLTTNDLV